MATFPSKVNYATGDILTATNMNEIGQAINLLDGAQFAAGKNKIINGDFGIWQRGTSFTNCATNTYTADRFIVTSTNSTIDVTRSTFTPGTAPVAGYEGQFFATVAAEATDTDPRISQFIEDVRTFAGQTITISFWAKSTVTTDALRFVRIQQNFGGGGSATVNTDSAAITLTASWARYTVSVAVPSISGKTIGTNSFLGVILGLKASTAQTLDTWGWQAEAASTASPFQTATGTKQGELAACQRYYWRNTATNANGAMVPSAFAFSATTAIGTMSCPVTMRTSPTTLETSGLNFRKFDDTIYSMSALTFDSSKTNPNIISIAGTIAGATAGWTGTVGANSNAAAYIGVGAEL